MIAVIDFLAIAMVMSVNNAGHIPWADKMRRLRAGTARNAEWMAPDEVLAQVRADYMEAIHWLQQSMLASWAQQWADAPHYLSGVYLKRHRNLLLAHREMNVQFTGVLRAHHHVDVRQFNSAGDFCMIIDHQSERRMATYNRTTLERSVTQDFGDGAVVYTMRYDPDSERWKIGGYVHELPVGWRTHASIRELSTLPDAIGRDY